MLPINVAVVSAAAAINMEIEMRYRRLLSGLLFTGCVGIYGSADVVAGQNTTDPVGVQVTEESSAGIVCTPEHLLQHSDSHVRDLGDLVESVVYTDGTRSEVVRINVKGTLDRDRVVQLWSTFEYILKHLS